MKVQYRLIRNSIHLNHIVPIIDQKQLLDELTKNGYQPVQKGQIIANALTIQSGDLAVKNNTVISLFVETTTLEITGLNVQDVLQITQEAESIITKAGLDLKKEKFREVSVACSIESGKNPIKSVQRFLGNPKQNVEFEKILKGKPVGNFTIRLMPKDAIVDTEEFYDVKIEPSLRRPTKEYTLSMNIRSKNKVNIEKFLLNLDKNLETMITIIETSD